MRRMTCQRSRAPVSAVTSDWMTHQVHQLPVDDLLQRQHPQRGRSVSPSSRNAYAAVSTCTASMPSQPRDRHRVEEEQAVEGEHVDHAARAAAAATWKSAR